MSMRTIARSSSNRNSASALASSVLPTPVGPEEQERAGGPVGVGDAGARPSDGVGHRADRVGLADDPLGETVLHPQQLLGLPLEQPAGGDPGPGLDDLGDVVGADLLLEHRLAGLHRLLGRGQGLLQLGQPAVAQLRGAGEVAVPLGALGLQPDVLQLLLDPLDALDGGLVLLPAERSARPAPGAGWPGPRGGRPGAAGRTRRPPWPAPSPRSPCRRTARSTSSTSTGRLSISMRSRLAASSTRSIALSGRKRAVTYRSDRVAAATIAVSVIRTPWWTS